MVYRANFRDSSSVSDLYFLFANGRGEAIFCPQTARRNYILSASGETKPVCQ